MGEVCWVGYMQKQGSLRNLCFLQVGWELGLVQQRCWCLRLFHGYGVVSYELGSKNAKPIFSGDLSGLRFQ